MKSRYSGLRTIGTLALILAWVLLILGIGAGIGSWIGLNSVQSFLRSTDLNINLGPLPFVAAVPGVLMGILGFLCYYAIGKVLRLLVDVDERTMELRQAGEQPAAPVDASADASGEMKRQAKLIAANLEATQDIQRQLASLESRMAGGQAIAAPAAAASREVQQAAATAGQEVAATVEEAVT